MRASTLRGMGQRASLAILWVALLLMALPATAAAATITETGQVGAYSLAGVEVGSTALALLVLAVAAVVATVATAVVHKLSPGAASRR